MPAGAPKIPVAELRRPGDPPDVALVDVQRLGRLWGYAPKTVKQLASEMLVPNGGTGSHPAYRWGLWIAGCAERGNARTAEERTANGNASRTAKSRDRWVAHESVDPQTAYRTALAVMTEALAGSRPEMATPEELRAEIGLGVMAVAVRAA